mgnify:CR=1 FL=1|jgi:mannose-6-phosphate isomerase-like protein (cupin superfamily)
MSLVKNWNDNIVNWGEIIEAYNTSIENNRQVKINLPGFFVCHNADIIEKVQKAMKILNAVDAHAYFNIAVKAETFGWHDDDFDVCYWQCIGRVKVLFEDKEFLLEPGDMIKIPKHIQHTVIPLTPRLGISMGVK